MVYAVLLAGGSGARMGNPDKPKQFIRIAGKPILVHTVEKFCAHGSFDKIIVLCPKAWVQQTRDLLKQYCAPFQDKLHVIAGGASRMDTVMAGLDYIEVTDGMTEDTIVVTHDAVRPFVSHRIISDNIEAAKHHGACDTVIPATDAIVESLDGETIESIPNRRNLYQGQTPQSFKALQLKRLYANLTIEERAILTDACKVYTLQGERVMLVRGDSSNIKITYPHDVRVARSLIEGAEGEEAAHAE